MKKLLVIFLALTLVVSSNLLVYATVPIAPTNVQAIGADGEITLSWDVVTDATEYHVKRSEQINGNYTELASNVTDAMFVDSTIENGKDYYYVITAHNSDGESVESAKIKGIGTKTRFLVVEVYDHHNGNSSYVNEIEVYDNEGRKISFTATEAFDSAVNKTPTYWSHGTYGKIKLNDGNKVALPLQVNYSSIAGTGTWTRMVLDLQDNKGVSKVDVWTHDTGKPRKNKYL